MKEQNQNMKELDNEKIRLEIEELRTKIINSKKSRAWEDFVKPIIPITITLIISIFGWIITGKFNQSQLTITENKNRADKEIAQINASLSYIKLMTEISDSSINLKQQAKTIIAPALPYESGFYIAINELPENPNVLEVLIRKHKDDYWQYLIPYIETYPLILQLNNAFRNPVKDTPIYNFLDKRHLLKDFYQFIISGSYLSENRIYTIINYFDYLYLINELSHNPAKGNEIKYQLLNTIQETSDLKLKSDISKAASIIFDQFQSSPIYTELAAKYFWENFNLSFGEIPNEKSIDQYIYANRFHIKDIYTHKQKELQAVTLLSNSLFEKLTKLNFKSYDVDRINVILYSYCETSPYDSKDPFTAYLNPNSIYKLLKIVLPTITSDKQKKEFAAYLGSLSGSVLFRNISQDKEVGEKYAELIINWYKANWKEDWYIPKFFSEVATEYPELKPKIDKNWGMWIE